MVLHHQGHNRGKEAFCGSPRHCTVVPAHRYIARSEQCRGAGRLANRADDAAKRFEQPVHILEVCQKLWIDHLFEYAAHAPVAEFSGLIQDVGDEEACAPKVCRQRTRDGRNAVAKTFARVDSGGCSEVNRHVESFVRQVQQEGRRSVAAPVGLNRAAPQRRGRPHIGGQGFVKQAGPSPGAGDRIETHVCCRHPGWPPRGQKPRPWRCPPPGVARRSAAIHSLFLPRASVPVSAPSCHVTQTVMSACVGRTRESVTRVLHHQGRRAERAATTAKPGSVEISEHATNRRI